MASATWKRKAFVLGVALLTAGLLGSRSVSTASRDGHGREEGKRWSKGEGKKDGKSKPAARKSQKKQNKGKKSQKNKTAY